MVVYRCDGCGRPMQRGELRYTVQIEVRAAYDEIEVGLADLVRDHRQEILALIARMERQDATRLEEQVYKKLSLDLCAACQQAYIRAPLHFHPGRSGAEPAFDVDAFLRSLGYGNTGEAD